MTKQVYTVAILSGIANAIKQECSFIDVNEINVNVCRADNSVASLNIKFNGSSFFKLILSYFKGERYVSYYEISATATAFDGLMRALRKKNIFLSRSELK